MAAATSPERELEWPTCAASLNPRLAKGAFEVIYCLKGTLDYRVDVRL